VTASVDRIQRRIALLTGFIGTLWWATGRPGARGVLVGGLVVLASVWLLARLFEAAIVTGRRRLAMALTFVKLAAFLGLGWIAFTLPSSAPDPLGFAVGVSTLAIAAVWEALQARRH
jgi:hypothetical protein